MTTKFKKGDHVQLKNYQCTLRIKEVVKLPDEQIAYKLIHQPPIPKELRWLPLFLRVELAVDTSIIPTNRQKEKDRTYKLNQLLK